TSKEIELQKQTMIDGMNQTASLKGKLQRYETMAEQVQLRRAELNQRLLHYRSEEAKQKEEYDSLSEKSHEMKEKLLIAESELSRKERQLVQLQEELNQQRQQSSSLQREYHVVESRLETMKNMTERYEGYGNSIKRVMEQKSKKQGIHGVVADLIKTDKKYEIAIETALGGSIQNIVTEDEQIAKELIEYLKKNRYGRATFLPLTSVKG
ncbi:MAG TPA: chromosome segregation protein SMC, partial [Lachnospiraceae bacterium]|nr:chromosome segregation protein SMC [Lachnospiraceae bacterium]